MAGGDGKSQMMETRGRLALKEGHLLFPTLSLNIHPSD